MGDLTYLSFSKISSYSGCSLKYYFNYVLKLPVITEKSALIFGGAGHKAIAFIHEHIKEHASPPNVLDAANQFETSFTNELLFNEVNMTTAEMNSMFDMGNNLIKLYYETYKKTDLFKKPPCAVEVGFDMPLIDYTTGEVSDDVVIKGYIDLIQPYEGKLYIIDHKFSSRTYNEHKIATNLQLTMYAYALKYMLENNQIENKDNLPLAVAFSGLYKLKTPKVLFHPSERTDSDIARMLCIVKNTLRGMKAGVYVPNFDHPYCASCDFLDACNLWGRYGEKEWMDIYFELLEKKQSEVQTG